VPPLGIKHRPVEASGAGQQAVVSDINLSVSCSDKLLGRASMLVWCRHSASNIALSKQAVQGSRRW
jgi:hypothetical protein